MRHLQDTRAFRARRTARGNLVQVFSRLNLKKGGGLRSGELVGDRTRDPRIKSALLYQLSYELLKGLPITKVAQDRRRSPPRTLHRVRPKPNSHGNPASSPLGISSTAQAQPQLPRYLRSIAKCTTLAISQAAGKMLLYSKKIPPEALVARGICAKVTKKW